MEIIEGRRLLNHKNTDNQINDLVQEYISAPYFLNREDFKTMKLEK